jgi:hypothetical protein
MEDNHRQRLVRVGDRFECAENCCPPRIITEANIRDYGILESPLTLGVMENYRLLYAGNVAPGSREAIENNTRSITANAEAFSRQLAVEKMADGIFFSYINAAENRIGADDRFALTTPTPQEKWQNHVEEEKRIAEIMLSRDANRTLTPMRVETYEAPVSGRGGMIGGVKRR